MHTVKVKFNDELEKLHILKLLELQNTTLNIQDWIDVEQLAARLSVNPETLLEVLLEMGCGIDEFSNAD